MNTWLVAAVRAAALVYTSPALERLVNSDGHYFCNLVLVKLFALQLLAELNFLSGRDLDLRILLERIEIQKGLLHFLTKTSNDL